jgi:hypothetical protein
VHQPLLLVYILELMGFAFPSLPFNALAQQRFLLTPRQQVLQPSLVDTKLYFDFTDK